MLLCILDHPKRIEPALWRAMAAGGRCPPSVRYLETGVTPSGSALQCSYELRHASLDSVVQELRTVQPRPEAMLLSGLHPPAIRRIRGAAAFLKIPVLLASDKTLNEPAPSGPIGLADSLFHAAKARGFAGFVTTGLFGTQYLVSLGCPRDRVTAGLCPVDVSAWQARKVRATEHARAARARMQGAAFIVLAVSALTPEAGVLVLLESFARLLRVQPNSFLICVGEGALRKAVRPRLGELGLEARVSFPGAVNDDELATYYASADVVASVPIFQEWGTRILEGMACGLPVVATTTSSSAGDLVVHGRSGALCQPGDPDSTTQALELVAQRVADRPGALGQFAFDVVQRFDVKLVAERLADLVERVAAESWRPPSVMSTVLSATRNEFGRWSL